MQNLSILEGLVPFPGKEAQMNPVNLAGTGTAISPGKHSPLQSQALPSMVLAFQAQDRFLEMELLISLTSQWLTGHVLHQGTMSQVLSLKVPSTALESQVGPSRYPDQASTLRPLDGTGLVTSHRNH